MQLIKEKLKIYFVLLFKINMENWLTSILFCRAQDRLTNYDEQQKFSVSCRLINKKEENKNKSVAMSYSSQKPRLGKIC